MEHPELTLTGKYFFARSSLANLLQRNGMYYTKALAATVDSWELRKGLKTARICAGKTIQVELDLDLLDMCISPSNIYPHPDLAKVTVVEINQGHPIEVSPLVPVYMVFHEIRHIPQLHTQIRLGQDLLLPEIQEKLKSESKRRKIDTIINICMDAVLNRDILKLPEIQAGFNQLNRILQEYQVKELFESLDKSPEQKIEAIKKAQEIRSSQILCTVDRFDELFPLPSGYTDHYREDLDWASMTNIAYMRLKEQHEQDKKSGKRQESKCKNCEGSLFDDDYEEDEINGSSMDGHDFESGEDGLSDEEREEIRKSRERRLDKAMREAEVIGNEQASKYSGVHAGDASMFVKDRKPDTRIVNLISRIRTKVMTLSSKPTYEASWRMTRERNSFCLPSEREGALKKNSTIVLVLDVSGSMWDEDILSQSFAVSKGLLKKGKLAALYQADTVLVRCDKQATMKTSMAVGGGGTDLNLNHITQIRNDLKLKSNTLIDVVYVTDGYVNLDEVKADPLVRLHVVLNHEGILSVPS